MFIVIVCKKWDIFLGYCFFRCKVMLNVDVVCRRDQILIFKPPVPYCTFGLNNDADGRRCRSDFVAVV